MKSHYLHGPPYHLPTIRSLCHKISRVNKFPTGEIGLPCYLQRTTINPDRAQNKPATYSALNINLFRSELMRGRLHAVIYRYIEIDR